MDHRHGTQCVGEVKPGSNRDEMFEKVHTVCGSSEKRRIKEV